MEIANKFKTDLDFIFDGSFHVLAFIF